VAAHREFRDAVGKGVKKRARSQPFASWFESEEVPAPKRHVRRWDRDVDEREKPDEEDEDGLKELDGNLRWPGKRRGGDLLVS
jgi:hypothetical protein